MRRNAGFSLIEVMIAMAVMLLVSGAAVTAILNLTTAQATIWNRTQMHSGIRGATEVLQQEVGQAGRIALASNSSACIYNPYAPCLTQPVTGRATGQTVTVSSVCGMFIGEQITVDLGGVQETVTINQINAAAADPTATQCPSGSTITAGSVSGVFLQDHVQYAPVQALGGFHAGIVPTSATNGSTAYVLKLFGDVNGDGNMVYVEYSVSPTCICLNTCPTTTGNLYRNSMPWNAASKTPAAPSQILLANVATNPSGAACFSYTPQPVNGRNYVIDVAVTLTVQTQQVDPVTKAYQTETKALLNVSPRNVFNTWSLASFGYTDRVQATPATVTTLLAGAS